MRSSGKAAVLLVGVCAAFDGALGAAPRLVGPRPSPSAARQSAARSIGEDAETLYRSLVSREERLRRELSVASPLRAQTPGHATTDPLPQLRGIATDYEALARRFPRSGYSDNALWQAALLLAEGYWRFGDARDKNTALRLFALLQSRFPSSSLVPRARAHVARLREAESSGAGSVILRAIRREVLPDAIRVTLELESEALFQEQQLEEPPRVFIDLRNTRAVPALQDVTVPFADEIVRQVRIGSQPDNRTRVVFDLGTATRYSAYSLYNPPRIVIDFERPQTSTPRAVVATSAPAPPPSTPPSVPAANGRGGFSLSRQLGLGISRIVIDPGHGGHDPGAKVRGLNEAELVLDIALRLEKLLARDPGVAVILTRRANTYVALEERTAIANRSSADLFLSIHANASANAAVRGFETYVLNFAANPEAEALAARENAASSRTMGSLPDIVKAIAMNNKIDESRDLAAMLQRSMQERLRKLDRGARSLGVKQAPFMVLLGATMPSALVEVSFLTNSQEAVLLRNTNYRQQIAEALLAGINRYQESLKAPARVAAQ